MVRSLFVGFFSKTRGPPRLRMQLVGVKRRRFYKIVAANQYDPPKGKHMEVLGSFVPRSVTPVKELRLRFSRVKFWLAVGAQGNCGMMSLLGKAGIIPPPPPIYGRRTCGQESKLNEMVEENIEKRGDLIRQWLKSGKKAEYEPVRETDKKTGEEVQRNRLSRYFIV